jgi:WD40 repeat protein
MNNTLNSYSEKPEKTSLMQMLSGITSAAISADGTRFALSMIGIENRGGLLIWDITDSRSVVGNYQSRLTQVDFSPDGTIVASTANDNSVVLWDANTGEARTILASDLEGINTFAWSPSGRMLAAADKRGTILLWEIPSYG